MATLITGANGSLAYWDGAPATPVARAFQATGTFQKPHLLSFAGLSAFADNGNHAPKGAEGAVTWDGGMELLLKIAGGPAAIRYPLASRAARPPRRFVN